MMVTSWSRFARAMALGLIALSAERLDAQTYRFAYLAKGGSDPGLYAAKSDSSSPLRLSSDTLVVLSEGGWSPNGRQLLFYSYAAREGDAAVLRHYVQFHMAVRVVNADGSGERLLMDVPAMIGTARWSPKGDRVLVASAVGASGDLDSAATAAKNGESSLQIVDVASGKRRILVPRLGSPVAAWSPDGTRIAYSKRTANGVEIAVIGVDNGTEHVITGLKQVSVHPAWSPDGKRIAFLIAPIPTAGSAVPTGEVGVVNVSAETMKIVAEGSASDVAWSPDGTKLLVSGTGDQTTGPYIVSPSGFSTPTVIDGVPNGVIDEVLTPDGTSVVYRRQEADAWSIWAAPLTGGDPRQLSPSGVNTLFFALAPTP